MRAVWCQKPERQRERVWEVALPSDTPTGPNYTQPFGLIRRILFRQSFRLGLKTQKTSGYGLSAKL